MEWLSRGGTVCKRQSQFGIPASWSRASRWFSALPPGVGGLPLPTVLSPAKEGVLERVEGGGSGGGPEQRCVSKRFSEKPSRVGKSWREGLARGPCFLGAAPARPSSRSREALGTAQLGRRATAGGQRDRGRWHTVPRAEDRCGPRRQNHGSHGGEAGGRTFLLSPRERTSGEASRLA